MNPTGKGMMIAATVAALLAGGAIRAADAAPKTAATVHCGGLNGCKGQGACAGSANSCKGQNACKGKGWSEMTAADCKDKGGKAMKAKKLKKPAAKPAAKPAN
jgi:hypothetical protein